VNVRRPSRQKGGSRCGTFLKHSSKSAWWMDRFHGGKNMCSELSFFRGATCGTPGGKGRIRARKGGRENNSGRRCARRVWRGLLFLKEGDGSSPSAENSISLENGGEREKTLGFLVFGILVRMGMTSLLSVQKTIKPKPRREEARTVKNAWDLYFLRERENPWTYGDSWELLRTNSMGRITCSRSWTLGKRKSISQRRAMGRQKQT